MASFEYSGYLLAALWGAFGGLILRGVFEVLRLRQDELNMPVTYAQLPSIMIYASVQDFVLRRNRSYARYILFRFIPVLLCVAPLMGIIQESAGYAILPRMVCVLFMVTVFYLFDIVGFRKECPALYKYKSVRLVYALTVVFTVIVAAAVAFVSTSFDFSIVVPSFEGLRDSLWAVLIAAVIAALYIRLTDMGKRGEGECNREKSRLYIKQRSEYLGVKYGSEIMHAAEMSDFDPSFVLSILVYEDMNRPKYVRVLENVFVMILPITLTVGIAQIESDRPLSDEKSILLLGDWLHESRQKSSNHAYGCQIEREVLSLYNENSAYVDNVLEVYETIRSERFD